MLRSKDLKKCHFIPMSIMRKVLHKIESTEIRAPSSLCKRNLATVQTYRCTDVFLDQTFRAMKNWKTVFHIACANAIYSHDWNKLLYLLKKCQQWEYGFTNAKLYARCLTILLMYHPTSQAKGLLNDYLHMVLSCRSDADKKAILKILLSLPDRIYSDANVQNNKEEHDEDNY